MGRFISQDPFGGSDADPISLHRYLYAGNDPVDMIDPGGQDETLFGVSMSTAVYSSLIGGTFSAAFGAWDTALNGGSSVDVLKSTAIGFALGAALGYGSTVQVLSAASRLIGIGFAISGAAGSYKAYQQGNTVLAIYRGMASTLGFIGSAGIIRSFLDDQTQVVPRTANDAALGPNAVPQQANGGAGGRQVNPVQLAEFNRDLAAAQAQRATDIRTDQPQVNANGNLVGNNRPDLQYTLNGRRVYIEYDGTARSGPSRSGPHASRLRANDPQGLIILKEFNGGGLTRSVNGGTESGTPPMVDASGDQDNE